MNDFFASAESHALLRTAFDLLGAESRALVLLDAELRIAAMTEGASALLDTSVLHSIAGLLSSDVVAALRVCARQKSSAELGDTIDEAPYRLHVRAHEGGLLLYLEPSFDLYRTALENFAEQRIRAALSSLLLASQKLATAAAAEVPQLSEIVRRQGLAIHRVLLHAGALTAPPAALSPDLAEGDLAALCRDLAARVAQDGVPEIVLELPESCPAIFDARLLTQAVCNLLTNAARAPQVTRITLRVCREQGNLLLSVEDNGRGLPLHILPQLYEGWHSLQTMAHALEDGADGLSWGLGLPLVQRIAGAHDGMLMCRPAAERGCVFSICLPDRRTMPYLLAQPALRVRDGFDVADIELSVLS